MSLNHVPQSFRIIGSCRVGNIEYSFHEQRTWAVFKEGTRKQPYGIIFSGWQCILLRLSHYKHFTLLLFSNMIYKINSMVKCLCLDMIVLITLILWLIVKAFTLFPFFIKFLLFRFCNNFYILRKINSYMPLMISITIIN